MLVPHQQPDAQLHETIAVVPELRLDEIEYVAPPDRLVVHLVPMRQDAPFDAAALEGLSLEKRV